MEIRCVKTLLSPEYALHVGVVDVNHTRPCVITADATNAPSTRRSAPSSFPFLVFGLRCDAFNAVSGP